VFETADEIMRRRGMTVCDKHALSWDWREYQPELLIYDLRSGEVRRTVEPFRPGQRLDLTISEVRRCVGSFSDAGYEPCMLRQPVHGQFDQCPMCASAWIPVQNCVFEPECDGAHCCVEGHEDGGAICAKEHQVYAAFYGDLIKVGMTLSTRLLQRALEQGADAVARLGTYPNRRAARNAENAISRALLATQWVRRAAFLKAQSNKRDRDTYQRRLDDRLSALEGVPVDPGPVIMLDHYPLSPFDPSAVSFVMVAGRHRGEVLGCKGR